MQSFSVLNKHIPVTLHLSVLSSQVLALPSVETCCFDWILLVGFGVCVHVCLTSIVYHYLSPICFSHLCPG